VDERLAAGRKGPAGADQQLERLAVELLDRGRLHDVVVRERGHRLDVPVGVADHAVHPHRQQARRQQDGGEQAGEQAGERTKHGARS